MLSQSSHTQTEAPVQGVTSVDADSSVALCHDPLVMSHAQLDVRQQHVVLS